MKDICSLCGKIIKISKHKHNKKWICYNCYKFIKLKNNYKGLGSINK